MYSTIVLYELSIERYTVHRVVLYFASKANHGAPLFELSWYPVSKYMKSVTNVDLATSLLHKSRKFAMCKVGQPQARPTEMEANMDIKKVAKASKMGNSKK